MSKINLFGVLYNGSGDDTNEIKASWGKNLDFLPTDFESPSLQSSLIETFEQIFLSSLSRIVEVDSEDDRKLVKGSSGPGLLKAKSIINANVSEMLMSQAFNVIFKEINNCNKSLSEYKGVDWSFYSMLYNRVRADNNGLHKGEIGEFPEEDD